MTKLITLTLVIFISIIHAQVTQQWVKTNNGLLNGNDVGEYVAVDGSGNIYVTGTTQGYADHSDILTVKYNSSGVLQWSVEYGNPFASYNFPDGIAVDNTGNVYIALTKYISDGVTHIVTIKYNSSGIQQWLSEYNGLISGLTDVSAMALDASGNIYLTGDCIGLMFNTDYVTIKYNNNGVKQWDKIYNGNSNGEDMSIGLAVDNSGNVYVTGWGDIIGPKGDYLTIKYSSNGTQQWISKYNGPANGNDIAGSIALDGSGNAYVTGYSWESDTYYHCATLKYNSSGVQQWVKRYNGGGNGDDSGNKIVFSGGNVYVGGYSQGVGTGRDYLVIKYSSSGNELWRATYNGPANGRDGVTGIAVDNYDLVYVTGYSKGVDGITHMTTVRYNSNGTQQWVQRYNSGQCSGYIDEGSYGIALGPNNGNGAVIVTGGVTHIDNNCSYTDLCIIKYTQTNLAVTPISTTVPEKYTLEQNYPNPFNPVTNIKFDVIKSGHVKMVIFDITGKIIAEPVNDNLSPGTYKVDIDASNYASGTYFYTLKTDDFTDTKKMVLVK